MALPRLPQHASYLREVETLYLRWEARITFVVYILTFACIMWLRDFGGLTTHECARISIEESFIVPLLVFIIVFGILYLVVLECYIKYSRDFKTWNKSWRTRKFEWNINAKDIVIFLVVASYKALHFYFIWFQLLINMCIFLHFVCYSQICLHRNVDNQKYPNDIEMFGITTFQK